MAQGIIPQAIIMRCHGIAPGTAGVMTVFDKADGNSGCLCTHLRIIAIHAVKELPLRIAVSARSHKSAAVAERVKIPDTPAVIRAETVHPGEDARLQ